MDLVDAHIKGLEWLLEGKGSRVFNSGTGTGFSVKEVIAECNAATGHDVPHSFGPRRASDAAALVSGSQQAAEELARIIAETTGFKGKILFDRSKPDDTPRKLMHVSRLSNMGWTARTGLRQGIEETYQWFLAHANELREV